MSGAGRGEAGRGGAGRVSTFLGGWVTGWLFLMEEGGVLGARVGGRGRGRAGLDRGGPPSLGRAALPHLMPSSIDCCCTGITPLNLP